MINKLNYIKYRNHNTNDWLIMIKSKWPLEVDFMFELDWNEYVILIEAFSNASNPLYKMLE